MSNRSRARHLGAQRVAAEGPDHPFMAAFYAAGVPMLMTDARCDDNPILAVNDAFLDLTGYARDEVIGRNGRFLQGPGTDQAVASRIAVAITAGERIETEILYYRKDGTPFWNALVINPIRDETGRLLYFIVSQVDISARQEAVARFSAAEERLERVADELQTALDRKTALLHEVDHRVKNNLQVIASLVHLQSRCLRDETAESALSNLAERISALSTVHRLLDPSGDAGHLDVAAFTRELLEDIGVEPGASEVKVDLALEPVTVPASQASALGLLVNEIAGRALRRASLERNDGRLHIAARQAGTNLVMTVEGDGVGPGGDQDASELGRTLINMLSKQLKAEIVRADAQPGMRVTITVPIAGRSA